MTNLQLGLRVTCRHVLVPEAPLVYRVSCKTHTTKDLLAIVNIEGLDIKNYDTTIISLYIAFVLLKLVLCQNDH